MDVRYIRFIAVLLFFFALPNQATAQTASWEGLLQEGRVSESYALAKQQLQGPKADFYLGVLAKQAEKHDEAIGYLTNALNSSPDLNDYVFLFRGESYLAKGESQKALDDFRKAESNSHLKFLNDVALFYQAEAHLALKQWKKAEPLYQKVSKRLKGTKYNPSILWGYLVSQMKNGKANKVCRQAKELYLKYPSFDKIADWSIILNDNTVNGKKLNCLATFGEQRLRLQRMLWAGLEEKALQEIQLLEKRASSQNRYHVDEIMVSYLLHEGHVDEAQKTLATYSKSKANDYDYLMLIGKVYSRSITPEKGIEAYYRAYQVSARAKEAAPALFQSAFLSYFVGDYSSASQKFKEFGQKYRTHRSYTDSVWYSAWLQYLQKDYVGAEKSFSDILAFKKSKPRLWSDQKEDRLNYWIAMSVLRQGKKDQAMELFSAMTHDDNLGYYSVAAYQRARQLSQSTGRSLASTDVKSVVHENWWLPEAVAGAAKKDHEEDNLTTPEDPFETKVDQILTFEDKAEEALSEEIVLKRIPQNLESDVKAVYFDNLEKTMHRAHALTRVGLDDLAYREVLGTEGRNLTNEQRQWLLQAHQSVNSFNRSVVLASYFYGEDAAKLGLHYGTDYWTYSYPKAYEKTVVRYTKSSKVKPEMVWSIMRAETIFRPDAISPVGARGLMQVMPRTGRKLASMSGDSIETNSLLNPPVSIKFGAQYLDRMSTKFKGNIALMAAAYNGGPHRVHAWMNYFGGLDMDEFVEHIPYQETRNYVKKVSKYYAIYNLLYSKKTDALELLVKPIGFKFEGSVPTMETWERY